MTEPRRYLIAAGTGTYAEHEPLPGAHPDVARIADLFAGMGYERVLTGVSLDPEAGDFEDALADWCAGDTLTVSDIVVVYYAGHGDRPDAGPYRLACAGSKAARPRTWLSLENLASVPAASPARNVLFIVDACYAGAGSPELAAVTAAFVAARARTDTPGSGTWVPASARPRDLAGDMGHFATELGRAYAAGEGASQRHLSPALLADRVNRAFVAAGCRQLAVCSVTDQSIQPPFFPNPAFDPAAEIGPDGVADGESTDVAAHFEPRGRGVEHVHDPGSYFTGRTHALDVVRARLSGPGGRGPPAVTGAPGSGKSAVLGRIVLEGGTAGGAHRVDVSINARHQTIDALVTRLAAAADVRASHVDALLTALAARVAPFRVVLDSLDEAGPGHDPNEARRIAWELLRPLGDVPCVRLVVGSRREHLRDWCDRAPTVDLDTAEYADDTSVAEYVERILTDGRSPYAEGDPATVGTIARAVARRAGRCFLVARMTASALLRDEPVDVTMPGWADALPSDVGGAFRAYLQRLPETRRSTALILLTALAFAEGHGLPREGVWTAVASRLSGESVVERDIDDLVDEEGSYLTTVAVGERRYFRLYPSRRVGGGQPGCPENRGPDTIARPAIDPGRRRRPRRPPVPPAGASVIETSAILGVSAVALGMVLTPGPNMMYVTSRSITQGRRAGLVSLLGVGLGFLIYMSMANLGLSAVFIVVPELYMAVKIAGAAYLGWLAWQALRPGGVSAFSPQELAPDSNRRLFTMGLLTNLLNPKAAIMYLSLIPQFVDPNAGHVLLQGFALGSIQIVISLTVNAILVLAAGSIAVFLARRPSWLRIQRYVMGTVLGGLAIKLATDRSHPATA